ncbi:unnamed protein product [Didymodactylos carnosus]|uniref:Uncharacterized protein n=2 Tax=Didymodactylos carnosus TaxID=1234261 RepID=A0A814MUI8_9BILA|nr:unnamed protein product [Didymodactylos carnosus]CAF3848998.1 unnamed protein product [Didymodactylos carnosus]
MNHGLINNPINDQNVARFTQQNSCPNTPNSASTPKRQIENEQYKSNLNKRPKATLNRQYLSNNNQYSVPFAHLKRADTVPCFIIQFDSNISPSELPSSVIASDLIHENLIQNGVRINPFSVAVLTGKYELKLGVNNKEDYSTLILTGKFIRYVPITFNLEQVKEEIKRSIKSTDHFNEIIYSYERPTRDYRFTVADLREYNVTLQLGRITVGNRLLPITTHKAANKMTYCTKCWGLGHLRDVCTILTQRCRICLELNKAVNMAICEGKLHRREKSQQQDQPITFRYNSNDFPVMTTDKIKYNPWNIQNNNSDQQNIMNYLQQMNHDIKQNFKQINDKLNIQQQVIEINTTNTYLNKIVIQSTLSTLSKMMNKVIKPLISLIQEERDKESVLMALDDYDHDLLKQHCCT